MVGPFAVRHNARTGLSDRLSQVRFNDDSCALRTEDLLRDVVARRGDQVDSVVRNPRHIESFAAPCHIVKLDGGRA